MPGGFLKKSGTLLCSMTATLVAVARLCAATRGVCGHAAAMPITTARGQRTRFFMREAYIAVIALCTLALSPSQFRSSVDLVPVFATVTTREGTFATGLTKTDFVLLDDGKPQEITAFAEEAQAISVFLILDTSGSVTTALPQI